MFKAPSLMRTASCALACALVALLASVAPAQTIDVSLNVIYADELDIDSGGTWEIVAKSNATDFGISLLSLKLTGIVPGTVQLEGPRGTVNGSDPAGFSMLTNTALGPGRLINVFQQAVSSPLAPADEQSMFYGVGTLVNGDPGDIGPAFTSLTNVMDVPWANTPDTLTPPFGNTAARLVSGTFAMGASPGFFAGTSGNVFDTLGTNKIPGEIVAATITTIVRSNFMGTLLPDYNRDGFIDAADYVVWRKGDLKADGNNDGLVNQLDYNLWRLHFGKTVPGAGAGAGMSSGATAGLSSSAIPEPTTAALLALGAMFVLNVRRRPARQLATP